MTALVSAADVAAITRVRIDLFDTFRLLADPKVDLVLDRAGIELDPQPVLVTLIDRQEQQSGGTGAQRETLADLVFRRPPPFDVARGDRFAMRDEDGVVTQTGVVTRAYADRGYVFAEAVIDVGRV